MTFRPEAVPPRPAATAADFTARVAQYPTVLAAVRRANDALAATLLVAPPADPIHER